VYKQPAEDSERSKKLKKLRILPLNTLGSVVDILQNEVYTLACYKHNGKPGIRPCVDNYGSAPDQDSTCKIVIGLHDDKGNAKQYYDVLADATTPFGNPFIGRHQATLMIICSGSMGNRSNK
jgi:hypothetical protein